MRDQNLHQSEPTPEMIELAARAYYAIEYSNTVPWDHRRAAVALKDKSRRRAEAMLRAVFEGQADG